MFLVAARALAAQVSDERIAEGGLYPAVRTLADISRSVALAVGREAMASGVAGIDPGINLAAAIDEAMWHPAYVPYIRSRAAVHREEQPAAHGDRAADEVTERPS
jgi:malate dehydrogenase (oxaloacetate-decarboxylating)